MALGSALVINNNTNMITAKAEEITITLNNIGANVATSATSTVRTTTVDDYVLNYYQAKKQSSASNHAIFLTKNVNPFISNKTAIPGTIKSVEVGILSGAAGATTYRVNFGTSELLAAGTTGTAVNITGGNSHVFTNEGTTETFFVVSLGNANNGQVHWLKIVYETQVILEPNISLDKESVRLLPEEQTQVTATANNFTATTFNWSKTDPSGVITLTNTTNSTVTITATTILGSATLTIEASDGTITKQQSITVIVSETAEGTYTIVSNTTTFNASPTIANLTITKTDSELENISLSNLNNFRVGATASGDSSVNVKMLFGGGETAPGSATFVLPAGLVATSVKLSGITRSTDATTPSPTLSINGVVKYTHSASVTEFTTKVYSNSVTISSAIKRVWVGSIELTVKTTNNAALDFGSYLLSKTDLECQNGNVTTATWSDLNTIYTNSDQDVKNVIKFANVNNEGNDLEKALGRYQVIRTIYGYTDFIGGSSSSLGTSITTKYNEMGLIMIISILGLTSLVGYYFFRKKSLN